jgi:hypothetical protein
MSLVEKVFLDGGDETLNKLLKDEDVKRLILKEVSKELPSYEGIIINYAKDQIMAIALEPDFADLDEGFYVGNILVKHMISGTQLEYSNSEEERSSNDIIPSLVYQNSLDLAEKCLISLSFFQESMERRTDMYGAPAPNTYMEVAQRIFVCEGWRSLSENFENWQDYLHEKFNLVNEKFDSNTYLDI